MERYPQSTSCRLHPGFGTPSPNPIFSAGWAVLLSTYMFTHNRPSFIHPCSAGMRGLQSTSTPSKPSLHKNQEAIAARHLMHEATSSRAQIPSRSSWMLLLAYISLSMLRYYFCRVTAYCNSNRQQVPWKSG